MNGRLVGVWVVAVVVGYGLAPSLAPDPTGLVTLAVGTGLTVAFGAAGRRLVRAE
ncbi:hypothetical protein [Halobaculum sp. MBLA0143]|uniref:hypothetical protein n=1 Tax=Halobaculum sp. MBLA0143 TaxID=3079933 RepID=UPI003525F8D7